MNKETLSTEETEGLVLNAQQFCRLIIGLRKIGFADNEVLDFLLWLESGDESKLPKRNID